MFELVTLANGARAVRHTGHGEVMHPAVGPWVEAREVYVRQSRLEEVLCVPGPPLVLLDVGLGAGTNAVAALTAAAALGARRRRAMHVWSIDHARDPLRLALADDAGFPFLVPWRAQAEALLSRGEADGDGYQWRLVLGDLKQVLARQQTPAAEVVFFDPFSPAANPTLWTEETLTALRSRCAADASVFTYSASTATRVSFLLAGFFVGAGVATGSKGETTVAATSLSRLASPLGARWRERWERSSRRAPHGAAELTPDVEARIRNHPQFAP